MPGSSRRQAANQEVEREHGLDFQKEEREAQNAQAAEEQRRAAKRRKQQELLNSGSYQMVRGVSKYFDCFLFKCIGLDAIVGFFIPGGVGDLLCSVVALPALYCALFKIGSIPLFLACALNSIKDACLGAIPFFIGDILDIAHRSNKKNLDLITGFVNDDKKVIKEVNEGAVTAVILIGVFIFLLYWVFRLIAWVGSGVAAGCDYISNLF